MSTRYDDEREYGRYGSRGEDRRDWGGGEDSAGPYGREGGYRGTSYRQDMGDYGRNRGGGSGHEYGRRDYGTGASGGPYFGGSGYEYGGEGHHGDRPDRNYNRGYGYGRENSYGLGYSGGDERSGQGYGGRGRDERGWWDRTRDEVASWFGDDEAERRRHRDERRSGGHRGRGPRGYKRSDERIREDISDRLADHDYLDASDIEVKVEGGEVTLSGTVESRWARRAAEDIAEDVSGVTYVQNNLRLSHGATGTGSHAVGTTQTTVGTETPAPGRARAKTA